MHGMALASESKDVKNDNEDIVMPLCLWGV